jgi:hypothetical protein
LIVAPLHLARRDRDRCSIERPIQSKDVTLAGPAQVAFASACAGELIVRSLVLGAAGVRPQATVESLSKRIAALYASTITRRQREGVGVRLGCR